MKFLYFSQCPGNVRAFEGELCIGENSSVIPHIHHVAVFYQPKPYCVFLRGLWETPERVVF